MKKLLFTLSLVASASQIFAMPSVITAMYTSAGMAALASSTDDDDFKIKYTIKKVGNVIYEITNNNLTHRNKFKVTIIFTHNGKSEKDVKTLTTEQLKALKDAFDNYNLIKFLLRNNDDITINVKY